MFDGYAKSINTTKSISYNLNKIHELIENMILDYNLSFGEYKRDLHCVVFDAAPGYVDVFLKDGKIKVEQDFCLWERKPYSFFNEISIIYREEIEPNFF